MKFVLSCRALVLGAALMASGSFAHGADKAPLYNPPVDVAADPCLAREVTANPTRPAWDLGAATTQCDVVETDVGFLWLAVGGGVKQKAIPASIRYGLTPRLDLRWGLGIHQWQSGGGFRPVQGAGDEWGNVRYRFHEQGRHSPALALDYGFKIPTANPSKGLGTGFVDHQFLFLASRDLGHTHLDFNTVGTLTGGARGHDGAAQFGLAVTQTFSKRFSGILESYGGPQPGISDRYGSALVGGLLSIRPWLVLDGAYTQAYTRGAPRRQALFGVTYARRAGWPPISRRFALARLLGR
jgi:hypothetical protein